MLQSSYNAPPHAETHQTTKFCSSETIIIVLAISDFYCCQREWEPAKLCGTVIIHYHDYDGGGVGGGGDGYHYYHYDYYYMCCNQ